jgi:RNA polymerase sigma-70 factor (ECF subfamily)
MKDEVFAERIGAMLQTLYRVSYTQLRQPCDRDEAVQEALCKAWEKRRQLRDERYFQTWLIRILINECRNLQRRGVHEETFEDLPAPPPDADRAAHDALLSLPDKLRLPAALYYLEGYKTREIAYLLRLPQGTVKSRLSAGRRALREILTEETIPCSI